MLATLLTGEAFAFLLVFARIGAALMVMPGIGDSYVPARIRLLLALLLTAVILPPLMPALPAVPTSPLLLAILVGGEVLVGIFFGSIARFLLSALEVAGTIISFQTSLANAMAFNPALATQGTLVSAFLTTLGVLLIFVTDLHHLMLMGIAESYGVFPPGALPPVGDMAETVTTIIGRSFRIGVQLSAPLMVIGVIFYFGLGLLNRLMPQMQIFFIAMPLQIAAGFIVMALTLSSAMLFWLASFQDSLIGFLQS